MRLPLFALTSLFALQAHAAVTGEAKVTDGDTIRIGTERIRIAGIDAPEKKQSCLDSDNLPYPCGIISRKALENLVVGRTVVCEQQSRDRYGRVIGECRVGEHDIGGLMVILGHAVAYRQYSKEYVGEEKIAKERRAGIWEGTFVMPWEFRKGAR